MTVIATAQNRKDEPMLPLHTLNASRHRPAAAHPARHLVIADGGAYARLLTLDQPHAPEVGHRFRFLDRHWSIVGYRRHARAFVARPVED
jgi:hypothetical protein